MTAEVSSTKNSLTLDCHVGETNNDLAAFAQCPCESAACSLDRCSNSSCPLVISNQTSGALIALLIHLISHSPLSGRRAFTRFQYTGKCVVQPIYLKLLPRHLWHALQGKHSMPSASDCLECRPRIRLPQTSCPVPTEPVFVDASRSTHGRPFSAFARFPSSEAFLHLSLVLFAIPLGHASRAGTRILAPREKAKLIWVLIRDYRHHRHYAWILLWGL